MAKVRLNLDLAAPEPLDGSAPGAVVEATDAEFSEYDEFGSLLGGGGGGRGGGGKRGVNMNRPKAKGMKMG